MQIEIVVGTACTDYQLPNYIAAIDELSSYFGATSLSINNDDMADALELYTKYLREDTC